MTDEHHLEDRPVEPGRSESVSENAWDPWGTGTSDPTAPVDLEHTREVDLGAPAGPPPGPPLTPLGSPGPMAPPPPSGPVWSSPADPAPIAPAPAVPAYSGAYPAPPPQGVPAYPSVGAAPTTRASARATGGPGWGAVVLVAAVAALLAALGGGVVGGWLVSSRSDGLAAGSGNDPSTVPTPGPAATSRPEGSVASIAAKALPSVVTINVSAAGGTATGSGWVYDAKGHLVTNNHVVADAGSDGSVTVVLSNGKQVTGTVIGADESYDVAVVRIDRTDLRPLPVGSSADVVVGDPVIAVGAPLGLDSTVTTGIVSALNRPVAPGGSGSGQSFINAIQTDAAINPGNSGGPLLDMRGQVIGVNSAIAQLPGSGGSSQTGSIGLGFAIPSDQVRKTVDQLIANGKAEHPVIGVLMDLNYSGEGVRIAATGSGGAPAVTPGGPADRAGLKPGDIILELEGKPMTAPDQLVVAIRAHSVGDKVSLKVRHDGADRQVTLTLEAAS